jgi:hypothetical protein
VPDHRLGDGAVARLRPRAIEGVGPRLGKVPTITFCSMAPRRGQGGERRRWNGAVRVRHGRWLRRGLLPVFDAGAGPSERTCRGDTGGTLNGKKRKLSTNQHNS